VDEKDGGERLIDLRGARIVAEGAGGAIEVIGGLKIQFAERERAIGLVNFARVFLLRAAQCLQSLHGPRDAGGCVVHGIAVPHSGHFCVLARMS
jgi:hypothetical protein